MADPKHLEILKQGVEAWNEWRMGCPETYPDLSKSNLSLFKLQSGDFRNADLRHATLYGADLTRANFELADLTGANLSRAKLKGTNFRKASCWGTIFGDLDLREPVNLELVRHVGPSMVGVQTLLRSEGKIPEKFLLGCGVPMGFIALLPTLVASLGDAPFYSCFISHSSKDQEFVERLHSDLQTEGVRVWCAAYDMPIGARLRPTIDETIRVHDKLLLVLSEHSVSSQWVEQEVETALSKERQSGSTVLFPIRLDDTVLEIGEGWPALLRNTRHVGDFTRWKDHDSYQRAFERLLRDLKAGA